MNEEPQINNNTPKDLGPQQIAVLDRGYVYVGAVTFEGDFIRITNCRNIRYWGTAKGLGELVDGPTSKTQLDPVGVVIAPIKSVIHLIPCSRAW